MNRVIQSLTLVCATFLVAVSNTPAQSKNQRGGIGFRNETKAPVLVEGASMVNGALRRGQPIRIAPGQVGWDANLNSGPRYVTIYDANQPNKVLYRDPPINFQGQDVVYGVKPMTNQSNRVQLVIMPTPKD